MAETNDDRADRRLPAEGEGLDFLRESLSWVVQQLMEAEGSVGWPCAAVGA
jgi:hypothetical protein